MRSKAETDHLLSSFIYEGSTPTQNTFFDETNSDGMAPKEVVLSYWAAMETNDFYLASKLLTIDCVVQWPQSHETIFGRENFAKINSQYPASGKWTFVLNSIVAERNQVVTDVSVSDGKLFERAITFHTVEDGLISKQVEFWPESFPAPEWRRQWVQVMGD